jgi:hypothetical protein
MFSGQDLTIDTEKLAIKICLVSEFIKMTSVP